MGFKAWIFVCAMLLTGGLLADTGGAQAATRCEKDDAWCQGLVQKTKNLKARAPAAAARAAMDKGDFRLGEDFYYGDPGGGYRRLPGVDCYIWPDAMIGKRHTHQDMIPAGGDEHTKASVAFLKSYNQTIVADPRFPWPDICAVEGRKWARSYTGVVTTVGQAARSRDVTKLKDLTLTPETANAKDELARRPLDWAIADEDIDMAAALIDAGADVRLAGDLDGTAVGLAILKERYDLAKAWRARGGRLPEETGLCPRYDNPRVPPPPPAPQDPDPDKITPASKCSWAGLLIQRGQFDMLDSLMTMPPADNGTPETIDGTDEAEPGGSDINRGFRLAVLKGDTATAKRLFPYTHEYSSDYPGEFIGWLYHHKQYDFLKTLVLSRHLGAARSTAEADLWRTALENGRYPAFAMLFDYGQQVNRLSKAQYAACRTAVLSGGDAEVFEACIKAGFERSETMIAAIRSGDTAGFKALVVDTVSLQEDYKISLDALVAFYGTPEMFTALTQTGVKPAPLHFMPNVLADDSETLFNPQVYDGGEKAHFDAYVAPYLNVPKIGNYWWYNQVVHLAYRRGDDAMLDAVLAAHYPGFAAALGGEIGIGNGLEKYIPGFVSIFDKQEDSEVYPNRPADPAVMARLQRDIPRVAASEGPQALAPLFGYTAQLGWNDVVQLILDSGFDARKVKDNGEMWFYFALFDSVCKPSTAHLLIKAGLPVRYKREGEFGDARLLYDLAATCRDGATIGVVIRDGGFDPNEPTDEAGRTAFDMATFRGHEDTLKTLTALGGKPGKDAHPDAWKAYRTTLAKEGFDPDLWQGPPEPE